jgi:hypothetical protein
MNHTKQTIHCLALKIVFSFHVQQQLLMAKIRKKLKSIETTPEMPTNWV